MIYRLYVEKKKGFDIEAKRLLGNISNFLHIKPANLRLFIRYDVEGLTYEQFLSTKDIIFSEPPVDDTYEKLEIEKDYKIFTFALIDGQFDQRADSAAQCAELLVGVKPVVKAAKTIAIKGISETELEKIINYCVNKLECEVVSEKLPDTLHRSLNYPQSIERMLNFTTLDDKNLERLHKESGFAMSLEDLKVVREYFKSENRQPTTTELKVIDTYWSDHCRHTTFLTELKKIEIECENPKLKNVFEQYCRLFEKHNGHRKDKYHCLMDIATIAVKELSSLGLLDDLDVSEEINACTIKVDLIVDGKQEKYLVLFKNETHNHPTEIEPFGGAATCLGGAIRDPLSGRAYVYQSMRISGAGDITEQIEKTLQGKLPQRTISTGAAAGFSSYGNQIGLSTGYVKEIFHNGYKAKRLECGFVVGSVLADNVIRSTPISGDKVLLIGGATGRDGCGGATGSSKSHNEDSVNTCGAEVQKGNAPEERKLQRLFRNPQFSKLINKCNDFGAGGVSVAIGELADSININLDAVPTKYDGLSGTEIAISESQERMAVVVRASDVQTIITLAAEENLDATVVAEVNDSGYLTMNYVGMEIVRLSRKFLDTNGARQQASAVIKDKNITFFEELNINTSEYLSKEDYASALKNELGRLNVCSQKGLIDMFDSTVGAGSVTLPLGGKEQLVESLVMAAKVADGSDTCTVASWGFNPYLCEQSPFVGAQHSVLLSIAKLIASGVSLDKIHLSFQEFFPKTSNSEKWGLPTSALLGALYAQLELSVAAIGGKDSMSGSFRDLDVPPTLISFALGTAESSSLITNVLDQPEQNLFWLPQKRDAYGNIDFRYSIKLFNFITQGIDLGKIKFATVVEEGGIATALAKSCIGNGIGCSFIKRSKELFKPYLGDFVISLTDSDYAAAKKVVTMHIATTNSSEQFSFGRSKLDIQTAKHSFVSTLENIFPTKTPFNGIIVPTLSFNGVSNVRPVSKTKKPLVVIPVFPGTNGEYDMEKQFLAAGAEVRQQIIRNRTANDITDSVKELCRLLDQAQIIAIPGGFSAGDEPDGSGKFIASVFSSEMLKESIYKLLNIRNGLAIGICNGFQALIKLGLLPYGNITRLNENSPTLTYNAISKHISTTAKIRVASCNSPWMQNVKVGDVYDIVISHGEGRFVCDNKTISTLITNGQIATQYIDENSLATMESPYNPNGSTYAIECLTSPDGRILGKMGHSERIGKNLFINCQGNYEMNIFRSGVDYFLK